MFHEEIFKMQYQNSLLKRNQQLPFLDSKQFKGKDWWGICFLVQFFFLTFICKDKSVLLNFHHFYFVAFFSYCHAPFFLFYPLQPPLPLMYSVDVSVGIKDLHLFPFHFFFIILSPFSGSLWPSFTTIITFQPHISF